MSSRLTLIILSLFWLTMTCLLWRSEFGGPSELRSAVPVQRVWEKILTAPDNSSLNIYHHNKKIGYCTWAASVGNEHATGKVASEDVDPEGMVDEISNYTLELEGNAFISAFTNNVHFNVFLKLSTNQTWQEFAIRATVRPASWELRAIAGEEKLHVRYDDEAGRVEKEFKFSDLQKPEFILQEFGGPTAFALMSMVGQQAIHTNKLSNISLGIPWEAHNDRMKFGHSEVRVYCIEAKILDRYKIFVYVSRVGEILWVHLPDELVFSNDAFTHF